MRVSFDIDDTLVLRNPNAAADPGLLPAWLLRSACEPLRAGCRKLIHELKRQRCEVWIYTSSLRSVLQVRYWLGLHGVTVDGIVNDDLHRARLTSLRLDHMPSKYPPAFGNDLRVDDSPGVRLEGERLGFKVLVIDQNDEHWTEKVVDAWKQMQSAL